MPISSRGGTARRTVLALSLGALTVGLVAPVADAASPKTKRVSVKSNGGEVDKASFGSVITPDGRYIAFSSNSDDLAGNDSNGRTDVYVRDMQKKKTRLVSIRSNGAQGTEESTTPAISANGRYVAFETYAPNLFKGDMNEDFDIVIRDRKKGKTKLISKSSSGAKGDDGSVDPDMTPDGRYVVFLSRASNLVAGDTMGITHLYIHDRVKKTTKLISKSSSGKRGNGSSGSPSVSASGRFVAFESHADNLVPNDNNGARDIFVHDRKKNRTTIVSVRSDGTDGGFDRDSTHATISADGLTVAFASEGDLAGSDDNGSMFDVYVHNRSTKKTRHVSVSSDGAGGNIGSHRPSISPEGRFIGFESEADNLVNGDDIGKLDVFIRDRKKGKTKRLSVGTNGSESDGVSSNSSVSAGGRFVTFTSRAANLIGSDGNGSSDVFRRGPLR
jgi:Tol biopolymer transport system component